MVLMHSFMHFSFSSKWSQAEEKFQATKDAAKGTDMEMRRTLMFRNSKTLVCAHPLKVVLCCPILC